ncbi:hypothetical protein BVY01_03995 [bacterium I07]|nr:hypothetical protein BVY01_03995 [bacterium I07]
MNYLENTLRYSNDEAFARDALYQKVFNGTAYAHPEDGFIESVKSIRLEDIQRFYNGHFTNDNVVIGVGGGYKSDLPGTLQGLLRELPGPVTEKSDGPAGMPDRSVERDEASSINFVPLKESSARGHQITLIEKETRSTAISIGFPIDVRRGEKDFYSLWIANSWFGEHRNSSSHLFQVIRETRGLNYGDYSYIEYFPNAWAHRFSPSNAARSRQIFEIWIRPVQNVHAHFTLRAAVRELENLAENGLSEEDFETTTKFLKKYHLHYAPTTSERLGYKIDDSFYGIEDHLSVLPRMLDELTPADVNEAVKRHIQYKNLQIAMVTENAAVLKKALVGNVPSPIKYDNPKPDEILEEDKQIVVYPLLINEENVKIVKAEEMFVG